MSRSGPLLQRFLFALGGVAAAALVAFGRALPNYRSEVLGLIPAGLLMAGMLALVRHGWPRAAMMLAGLVVPVRLAFSGGSPGGATAPGRSLPDLGPLSGWQLHEWVSDVVGGLSLGFGAFAIALVFHALSERGWKFGKFLILGPLLGALYVALLPLEQLGEILPAVTRPRVLFSFYLGLIVGDGAGFGAELYDLLGPPQVADADAGIGEEL